MPCYYSAEQQKIAAGRFAELIDGFTLGALARGYSESAIGTRRLGAIHLGAWCRKHHVPPEKLNEQVVARFEKHLSACRCPIRRRDGEAQQKMDALGAREILEYLRSLRIARPARRVKRAPVIEKYIRWLTNQQMAESSIQAYVHIVEQFVAAVGQDPQSYEAKDIRDFVRRHRHGRPELYKKREICALRSFLNYLVVHGRCGPTLVDVLPKTVRWHHSAAPRFLSPAEAERAIATASLSTPKGVRDRAILLLLARLGMRACEVARLRIADIDWDRHRIRFAASKSRRVHCLPMPKDVEQALWRYLTKARPPSPDECVFVRTRAPFVHDDDGNMVTHVATRAFGEAGIQAPSLGARAFRRSIATMLLRAGASLDAIGALLGHKHHKTTTIYTHVDLDTLRLPVQPWPRKKRDSRGK